MNAVETYGVAIDYYAARTSGTRTFHLRSPKNGVDTDYTHAPALFTA
jgi:hypothetical protein